MRVIITGGSGLLGRALAENLAADGNEVVVLSRRPQSVRGLPAGVRAEQWDGRTAAGWGALASGAGAIVNLAGENLSSGRWTAARKQRIVQSRVNAGRAVLEAVQAAAVKPAVVIQASGIGHYGPHGDEVLTEQSPAGDDFAARITLDWEAATAPLDALGVRRAVVRMGPSLTPHGGALPLMMLPFRMFMGGPLGSGKQWLSWIHIADTIAALRFLMDHESARGIFNVCSPQPVTNAEFGRVLGRVMRRPYWLPAPAFAMRLALGEMASTVLEGQRAAPAHLQELGFAFRFAALEPALRDLLG